MPAHVYDVSELETVGDYEDRSVFEYGPEQAPELFELITGQGPLVIGGVSEALAANKQLVRNKLPRSPLRSDQMITAYNLTDHNVDTTKGTFYVGLSEETRERLNHWHDAGRPLSTGKIEKVELWIPSKARKILEKVNSKTYTVKGGVRPTEAQRIVAPFESADERYLDAARSFADKY